VSASEGHALVLTVKPFAEGGALVHLFCRERGLVKGLIKKGASRLRLLPMDEVAYKHYRRLDSQLGSLAIEPVFSRAAWALGSRRAGAVGSYLAELLGQLLPEEHGYPMVWEDVQGLLAGATGWADVARFERNFLAAAGYGLPLADDPVPCAERAPLAYVSPVTGRAVSVVAGAPYVGRLLVLPQIWGGPVAEAAADCRAALGLTGFFVQRMAGEKKLGARRMLVDFLQGEFQTTARAVGE
jgi:DNA repair protein RecO (recombination protein O)